MTNRKTLTNLNDLSELDISKRLLRFQYFPQAEHPFEFSENRSSPTRILRNAAVLLPLTCRRGGWHLLLTRRNDNLPEHSGQVAFPGGRSSPEDGSPEQTALREAYEEVGIAPQDIRLLGRLPDFVSVSDYRVTPVVGAFSWPYRLKLAPDEVVRAFTIPLNWLANTENFEFRTHESQHSEAPVQVVYYRLYRGELLWGLSARFVLALVDALAAPESRLSRKFSG